MPDGHREVALAVPLAGRDDPRRRATVTRKCDPVIAGNCTGAATAAFGVAWSVTGGTATSRRSPASLVIAILVGTEWRPSATSWRSRWSTRDRVRRRCTSTTGRRRCENGVTHAVAGSWSSAADARSCGAPERCADDVATTGPVYPRSRSICVVGQERREPGVAGDAEARARSAARTGGRATARGRCGAAPGSPGRGS